MQESPFIEHLIQKYSEQGSREMSIKDILTVLTERFPQSDVQPVEQALESIQDIDRLTELHRTAVKTPSLRYSQTLNIGKIKSIRNLYRRK